MARICLINPRFPTSFWGLNHGLPLLGKKSNMPVLALPVLAGLTPPGHELLLIDENIEEIDFDEVERCDIVGITGMTVQRDRMREILEELRSRGCFVVIGGPWVSVAEDWFADLVDVSFIGEAEETWPRFLEEWAENKHAARYEQKDKTDMTKVPIPRYDLVPFREYAMGCIQTSRGCPFQCEFCDIIVIFGRKPRIKTTEMVISEIQAQHDQGVRVIFLVDDNFIGNKKAAKVILRAIVAWQRENGYPLSFFTEASLDLAEDDELMRLMAEAGMVAVFIGIESPDEEALRETKKFQNVRPGSMIDKVKKVQDAGLEVYAGMIVGFDKDDATVFDRQYEFLQEARVVGAMAGMLSAIPKTPLYARLEAEGRARQRGGRRSQHRHQRDPAQHEPRNLAGRLARPDGPALRRRPLLRTLRCPVHRGQAPSGLRQDGLAPSSQVWHLPEAPDAHDPRRPGHVGQNLGRPPDAPRSSGLCQIPPQADRGATAAALPVPVRIQVRHAHPLRHDDPADGPGRIAPGQHLNRPKSLRDGPVGAMIGPFSHPSWRPIR